MAKKTAAPGNFASFALGNVPPLTSPDLGSTWGDLAQLASSAVKGFAGQKEKAAESALKQAEMTEAQRHAQATEATAAQQAEADTKRVEVEKAKLDQLIKDADLKRSELKQRADALRASLIERKALSPEEAMTLGDEDVIAVGRQHLAPQTFAFQPTGPEGEITGFGTRGPAAGATIHTGETRTPSVMQGQRAGAAAEARQALQIMHQIDVEHPEAAEKFSQTFGGVSILGEGTGVLGTIGRGIDAARARMAFAGDDAAQQYYQAVAALRLSLAGIRGQRPNSIILGLERSLQRVSGETAASRAVRYRLLNALVNELERSSGLQQGGVPGGEAATAAPQASPEDAAVSAFFKKKDNE